MMDRLIVLFWDPDVTIDFKDFGTWVEEHTNWSSSKKNKYVDQYLLEKKGQFSNKYGFDLMVKSGETCISKAISKEDSD